MATTKKVFFSEIVRGDTPVHPPKVHVLVDVNMFDCNIDAPLIHNFANNEHPGGPCSEFSPDGHFLWHDDRSKTQEDQVVTRFKEWIRFPHDLYPICTPDSIACIVHHGEPPVLTLPAPHRPRLTDPAVRQDVIKRIHLALFVANKMQRNLVTGLWGCGAFKANPAHMADIWKEALRTAPAAPTNVFFCLSIDRFSKRWGQSAFDAFVGLADAFQ